MLFGESGVNLKVMEGRIFLDMDRRGLEVIADKSGVMVLGGEARSVN